MVSLTSGWAFAIDCGTETAREGGAFESRPWDRVLARLQREGVIQPVDFEIEPHFFGYQSDGPLGDIAIGTLSERQFMAGLEEVQSTAPGLIYTLLLTKWAAQIEQDYGAPYGQLFFLFLLNPEQRHSDTLNDVGLEIGKIVFRQTPSVVDLAILRRQAMAESEQRWEKACWTSVREGLARLERDLDPSSLPFETLDRTVRLLQPRRVHEASDRARRRFYDIEFKITGYEANGWNAPMPFGFQLKETVQLQERVASPTPFVLLDLWDYGRFPRQVDGHLAVRADIKDSPLGGALSIRPETARRMRHDLQELRAAVTDEFGR